MLDDLPARQDICPGRATEGGEQRIDARGLNTERRQLDTSGEEFFAWDATLQCPPIGADGWQHVSAPSVAGGAKRPADSASQAEARPPVRTPPGGLHLTAGHPAAGLFGEVMTLPLHSPSRLGSREAVVLAITPVFFASVVALAALGLPVVDILTLMGATAAACVVTVTAMSAAGAARAARDAECEAVALLARLAGQA
ncbi:hypothetical protein ACIQKB_38680 [Streptomyces sp. NPDC092046]|uniref:hypothetical protein n=1 Tax=Streptomyces sp. NPDC092046 TaxID=3366009 RepID=UPI00381766DD